jgi:HD superfamily phosphohydrolase
LPIDWEGKLVRDPLYGFIGLSKEEEKLLDTPLMQRLSRIKQLSHTYIVYPSAVHTRFEHSLGSLYIAGRVCDELRLSQDKKRIVRFAGLLHDIGQGPFSHLFEEPMRWINGEEGFYTTLRQRKADCQ